MPSFDIRTRVLDAVRDPHPSHQKLLALKEHAAECLKFLSDPEQNLPADLNHDSLAVVYATLVGEELASGEAEVHGEAEGRGSEEDEQLGRYFVSVLLRDLPPTLLDFERAFQNVPRASEDVQRLLLSHPSNMRAGPYANVLAKFGMTPATFADAGTTISALLRRSRDGDAVTTPIAVQQHGTSRYAGSPVISRSDLIEEVSWTTELPNETSACLVDWLLEAAKVKSLIFDGFRASWQNGFLHLHPCREIQDFAVLWATPIRR